MAPGLLICQAPFCYYFAALQLSARFGPPRGGAVVFWQLSIGIGALMLRGQGGGIGERFYVMSTDSVSVSTFFDVYVC